MARDVRLEELPGPAESPLSVGTSALDADPATMVLRFRIVGSDPETLEAIRHARRSILREEWTKGRDTEEPSLEDAVFSSREIVWGVLPGQKTWCLEKLEDLEHRASRYLEEMRHL